METRTEIKDQVFSWLLTRQEFATIEQLLVESQGNVPWAITTGSHKGSSYRSFNIGLGNKGKFGSGELSYRAAGSAPNGTIRVWLDGMNIVSEPDCEFTWNDVYEWVKEKSDKVNRQLKLF